MEIPEIEQKLDAALNRIEHLEEQMNHLHETTRWHYLTQRPHRWRRQLSIKGRNTTVGQLVSAIRANQLTPEQAAEELEFCSASVESGRTLRSG